MRDDCHDGLRRGSPQPDPRAHCREDGRTEQQMFGGVGFMIDGHMAIGVSG
jgi:hypothetical protein